MFIFVIRYLNFDLEEPTGCFVFNMGIKDLWSILEPYCERKPLFELEGKIVAIDLAGWVCESMCVVDYAVQPRFYLR